MISIIIPTLNEENYLPRLLESLYEQRFKDYEIIIADAGSQDSTVTIAQSYGCQVIKGGLPAVGRNEGAKVASGDLLLFLDSDVTLPEGFLKIAWGEFTRRSLDVASFALRPENNSKAVKLLFNLFYNWPARILAKVRPYGAQAILVKKSFHQQIQGFDPTIKLAEDVDYVRRANKIGKFGFVGSYPVWSSLRRYQQDGWVITYLKYLLCELYMMVLGPVRSDIFNYRFDHYSRDKIKFPIWKKKKNQST